MTRIAFAMEQSLGNVTHYLNLRANADAAAYSYVDAAIDQAHRAVTEVMA